MFVISKEKYQMQKQIISCRPKATIPALTNVIVM